MDELINYLNEINELQFLSTTLNWEMDTIVPKKSYDYFAEVSAKLDSKAFKMQTSKKYIELLNNAIKSEEFKNLEEHKQRYILELRDNNLKKNIPIDFYNKYIILKSKSKQIWTQAKSENNYSIFKPYLENMVNMTKQLYMYTYSDSKELYDSMLDDYEKNIKSNDIDKLFSKLKERIIPLVSNLEKKELKKIDNKYSDSELLEISKYLLNYIGFDNDRGALGIFPHGYTETLSKNDVRIAFGNNRNIFDHISTIIHEGGHGIFEQRANEEYKRLNSYSASTIALHESQSRFYENILGRNINFWIPIYDDVKKMTKLDMDIEEFIKYFNNAQPSLIRTEADELTYCLHIIIRYEIERKLFNNEIEVEQLPRIWNQKYKEYLGIDVLNDSDGILQDLHWADGLFGYFPSYLLGSIFDGMLIETIDEKVGNINTLLREGKIQEITKFLNENIHKYGGSYNIFEVCERVCKKEMNVDALANYFEEKYGKNKELIKI